MADDKADIVTETHLLERAVRRKWSKYTWSGLLLIVFGIILILVGVAMNTGAYSFESLLIGFGAIIVIAGIIRILIGVINPSSPEELRTVVEVPPLAGEAQASEEGSV